MPAAKKKIAKKTAKPCDCVEKVNKQIENQGVELDSRMVMSFVKDGASGGIEAPIIKLCWLDAKRKKPAPPMFCSYCPFCGQKKAQG